MIHTLKQNTSGAIMGWTGLSQYEYDTTKVSGLKAFFQNRFFNTNCEIVACSAKNNVFYCAVKENETENVTCYVFKYSNARTNDGCNFAFKDMHECEVPYCYEPSQKVLDALSDTDNENSLKWREKCKELKEKSKIKFEIGDIIQFDNEITFNGYSEKVFILASDGKNFTYYDGDRDYSKWTKNDLIPRYRISKWKTKEFKIIGNVLKKF